LETASSLASGKKNLSYNPIANWKKYFICNPLATEIKTHLQPRLQKEKNLSCNHTCNSRKKYRLQSHLQLEKSQLQPHLQLKKVSVETTLAIAKKASIATALATEKTLKCNHMYN
jgi:hypothetical protein